MYTTGWEHILKEGNILHFSLYALFIPDVLFVSWLHVVLLLRYGSLLLCPHSSGTAVPRLQHTDLPSESPVVSPYNLFEVTLVCFTLLINDICNSEWLSNGSLSFSVRVIGELWKSFHKGDWAKVEAAHWEAIHLLKIFFKNLFIFRQRGREGEREGEKHQCVVASCIPLLGTWLITQACALTGNWTSDPLALSPLSYTSQGWGHPSFNSIFCWRS